MSAHGQQVSTGRCLTVYEHVALAGSPQRQLQGVILSTSPPKAVTFPVRGTATTPLVLFLASLLPPWQTCCAASTSLSTHQTLTVVTTSSSSTLKRFTFLPTSATAKCATTTPVTRVVCAP